MADTMNLTDLKLALNQEIKRSFDQLILDAYPIETQLDHCTGVIDDATAKSDMVTFIKSKRTEMADISAKIDALTDTSLLDGLDHRDDQASWITLIDSKITLSNESQKIMMALALRAIKHSA